MSKLVKCKSCGADVAKSAKTCPACGAKNKKKHPILGAVLVFLGIVMVVAAFGSSSEEPQKVGDAGDQQAVVSSESQEVKKDEFGVGEKVELSDVAVTLVDISENAGTDLIKPTDGNVFVVCEFEIENNTDHDIAVSSMMSFEAYFDDYATNLDIYAMTLSDKTQLDGTIASGKKMKGVVGYQAPSDWQEVELHFTPDFWSTKDIVFSHAK